jgi:hypothetical protein
MACESFCCFLTETLEELVKLFTSSWADWPLSSSGRAPAIASGISSACDSAAFCFPLPFFVAALALDDARGFAAGVLLLVVAALPFDRVFLAGGASLSLLIEIAATDAAAPFERVFLAIGASFSLSIGMVASAFVLSTLVLRARFLGAMFVRVGLEKSQDKTQLMDSIECYYFFGEKEYLLRLGKSRSRQQGSGPMQGRTPNNVTAAPTSSTCDTHSLS